MKDETKALLLRKTTLPTFAIICLACLTPMVLLGYDGWILRKAFGGTKIM